MNKTKVTRNTKKVGRKVIPAITTLSSEDRLNTIADLIIERLLEEKNKTSNV